MVRYWDNGLKPWLYRTRVLCANVGGKLFIARCFVFPLHLVKRVIIEQTTL
jgi:hypothetical protein